MFLPDLDLPKNYLSPSVLIPYLIRIDGVRKNFYWGFCEV